ncbi:MAG TPA: hypothetical protein VLI71_16630 [Gammaproteobacteria bacterium]|nr:hypothetical protein [Gammaproteobacteria bacterium]
MKRLLAGCAIVALAVIPLAASAQQTPITRYARFTGTINFVATGGSLRTQPNTGNSCAVGASSTQTLAGIPAGASIVAAYLYWGGSGAAVDANVTLNGQGVAAQRTFTATFNNGGTNFPYFGGFADITSRITGNGALTFSGLTVTTGAPHCGSSAVVAGWSVVAIYGSPSERLRAVNVFDGLQFFRGNNLLLNPDGFRIPPTNFDGRMTVVTWEGDPGNSTPMNGFSEVLRFNGTAVDDGIVVPGSDPAIQPYDGTVNSAGVATSYGVDVDTFDVTALLAPGQTSATTEYSAGGDLVLLTAQIVSATSEPVVDLTLTKTHVGNFTVGGSNVYTLTVANAAGNQREDNTVVVTDTLPAGLTFVSGVGTGWACGASGQTVTCTHPPILDPGNSLPPITMTVTATGAAVPSVTNTASVGSASFDVNAANNTASDVTVVIGPNLSTSTKSVVDLNGGEPDPGDTLRYTITLLESDGIAATGVSVVDDLAAELGNLAVVSIPPGATNASTGAGTGTNGTGRLDIGNIFVPANGSAAVVFDARIAVGTTPGTPIDNTATIANPGGFGATPAAPTLIVSPSAIPSSGSKPLYLRSAPGVSLSRNPPSTDANVVVASGLPVTWTLTPALALPVTLPTGNIAVPLWLRRNVTNNPTTRTLVVTLANSATGVIGFTTQTVSPPGSGNPAAFPFVIVNPATTTFPAGSTFSLTIAQTLPTAANRTTLVYPVGVGAGNFSRVVLNSATVIDVNSVQTFNAAYPGGAAQASFDYGSTVYVRAVVSDPFGSFDIASARISIVDSASVVRVANAVLPMVADSGAATLTYEYAYVVPAGSPSGGWSAQVTAVEGTEGVVTHTRTGGFIVPPLLPALRVTKSVQVLSDPVNGAVNPFQIPGSLQRYRVTVTNTGVGSVDASTLVIDDVVPANAELFVASGGGDPVQFVDGATPSGLTFDYATHVTYSSQPGGVPPYSYVPTANGNGVDPNVTALRIAPSGAMPGAAGANEPSFSVEFRVRVR